jgi:phage terminase small subunit
LRANGQLLRIDSAVIETFVTAVIRQRRLTAVLDKADLVDKDGKPHPLLRTIEATATTIKNLSHVLGLNPLARKALPARVKQPRLNRGKGADPWSGVLAE